VVEAQIEPDGSFPTVDFPNPEEPGAMDLSFAKASEVGADLILANDPDADRLAVAVPDCTQGSGWRKLTGDEVGLLLGDAVAEAAVASDKTGVLANSIVSSSVLTRVAAHYGLEHRKTLTGFKWISKVPGLIFGFEEALGYCVDPANVPDKDGISAALLVADLAAKLKAQGKTLDDKLAELSERYGYFATGQISIRVSDLSLIGKVMAKLREQPPASLLGQTAKFTDMSLGFDGLPATEGLLFETDGGLRVIVRPSGTEPKLKCYLQAIGSSAAEAKTLLAQLSAVMKTELGA
jgi:phosphomannomutase